MEARMSARNTYARLRSQILSVRNDRTFMSGLQQALGEESHETLAKRLEKLVDDNLYVAILGRQGVGKSSLINSLLFSTEILPIGVDETTNVLCKVVHDRGKGPGAQILFKNGKTEEGPPTRDFLNDYVDEQANPGNEKRVKEILVSYPIPYLAEGIAFVDTPGVGSLLSHNMRTTMEFLPNVSCAIFLFSTTPSLLESEVEFLRTTWNFSQNFFFVQNVWGEDANDITGSRSRNLKIIQDLAEEMGTDPEALKVFPVDIHKALNGARNCEEKLFAESGAAALAGEIRSFLAQGAGKLRLLEGAETVGMYASRMQQACADRVASLRNQGQEEDLVFRDRIDQQKDDLRFIEREWDEAKAQFESDCLQMERDFDQNIDSRFENARKDLDGLVNSGSLDAKRFGKALTERIQLEARAAQEELARNFRITSQSLVDSFVKGMENVSEVGAIPAYQDAAEGAVGFDEVGEKIGGTFQWGGSLGFFGAVGASLWAGGAALAGGGGAATAFAAAAAAVPGPGWVLAGAALLGGWLFKKYSKGKKIAHLQGVLFDAIAESRRAIRQAIGKNFRDQAAEVKRQLDEDMQRQVEEKRLLLVALEQDRALGREERERLAEILRENQTIGENMEKRFVDVREEVLEL